MKKVIPILLALFIALSYSCSNKEPVLIFPSSRSISGVKYDVPGLLIGLPSSIVNVGNSLAILNSQSTSKLIVINKESRSIIKMGNKGKGPGELLMPFTIRNSSLDNKFDVYDFMNRKIFRYDIDLCKADQLINRPIKTVRLPDLVDENKQQIILSAIELKNKHLLMYGLFDDRYMFQITDSTNTVKSRFGEYDFDEQDNNPMINKCLAYQGIFDVRDSVLVWACRNAQIIETYNIGNLEKVHRTRRIKLGTPLYKPQNTGTGHASGYLKENKTGYIDMALSDDRVYLLYSGRKFKKDDHTYNQRSKQIQVFDFNLNAIEKVMLDKEVSRITLSPDKSIYAIQYTPEPIVLSFYLPNSKLKL